MAAASMLETMLSALALGLAALGLAVMFVAGLRPATPALLSAALGAGGVVVAVSTAQAQLPCPTPALLWASVAMIFAVQRHTVVGAGALLAARAENVLRPWMCRLLPTKLVVLIYSATRSQFLAALSAGRYGPFSGHTHPTKVFGLTFRNDLGNAAGLDKDGTMLDWFWRSGAGFAVVGTVLDEPHTGNLHVLNRFNPWVPLPGSGGGINSLGLPSKGVDKALKNIALFRGRLGDKLKDFPIGLSVMGHPAQQGGRKLQGVLDCVAKAAELVDFIEINESCPNVAHASHDDAALEARLARIVATRDQQDKRVPLLVKLGDLGDAEHTLQMLERLGIDGVVALNTQKDYASFEAELPATDLSVLKAYTGLYGGGLSGKPIAARAHSQMEAAARVVEEQKLKIRLVHVGGISEKEDVQRSRDAGVHLREWYTGLMHNVATVDAPLLYSSMTAGGQAQAAAAAARTQGRSKSR